MNEWYTLLGICAFFVLLFWQVGTRRKEYSHILDPKNEQMVIKLAFYDSSYKKDSLEKLRSVVKRIEAEKVDRDKGRIIIRLYPIDTRLEYVEQLIEKIESDFYAKKLSLLSKEEQRLDNWDLF